MNNEEKILLLLEKMDKRIDTIDNKMDINDKKIDTMDKRMGIMEKEIASGRELTELIAAQVGRLTTTVSELTTTVGKLTTQVDNITKTVTRIESGHGQKLSALFDGYKQNSDKLDRIEIEVAKHDRFILEKI
jgi:chromosome segregation ATPase